MTESAQATVCRPTEYRQILELAVREVFEIMLATRLETCEAKPTTAARLTAMVGLAGSLCAVLSVCCSDALAKTMASRMLGVAADEADGNVWDALGEIANMVAGNFKNKLTGPQGRCMLSVPTVVMGSDYQMHSLSDGAAIQMAFWFETESFWVTLEFHS